MKDEIKYSNHISGDPRNFNWDVRFDIHLPDGYVGVTQYDNGKIKERVLLSPVQVKALQMFLRANNASSGLATTCPLCGYMAKYPICTKCGEAISANR